MRPINYFQLLLLISLFLSATMLAAQDSTRVRTEPQRTTLDDATQMMIDNPDMTERLIVGGGFTVRNPELEYEIDEDKLYLNPEFRPYVITLVGGLTDTLLARLQLVDQLVEVAVDNQDLQIASQSLQSITTDDGRHFVALRRPLVKGDPAPLAEVLFSSGEYRLYAYRRVEWREPSYQRTSYDSDNYKKRLDREDRIYVITPEATTEQVRKLKQLVELLPADKRDAARRYAKQERLRNREEDYIQLLTYLNQAE